MILNFEKGTALATRLWLQNKKQICVYIRAIAKYLYTIRHIHSRKHKISILTVINIQSPTFLSNLHNTTQHNKQ